MGERCWYCDQDCCDHKHGVGVACGDCCGMHGSLCRENGEAYRWVTSCLKAKNERIATLTAELERVKEEWDSLAKHAEAIEQKYIDCPHPKDEQYWPCACSYDAPSDVCMIHAPQLKKALAENKQLREELRTAESERDFYASQVNVNRDGVNVIGAILKQRDEQYQTAARYIHLHTVVEQEIEALREQVRVLSAPVSDEEMRKHGFDIDGEYIQPTETKRGYYLQDRVLDDEGIDALIAARAAQKGDADGQG